MANTFWDVEFGFDKMEDAMNHGEKYLNKAKKLFKDDNAAVIINHAKSGKYNAVIVHKTGSLIIPPKDENLVKESLKYMEKTFKARGYISQGCSLNPNWDIAYKLFQQAFGKMKKLNDKQGICVSIC